MPRGGRRRGRGRRGGGGGERTPAARSDAAQKEQKELAGGKSRSARRRRARRSQRPESARARGGPSAIESMVAPKTLQTLPPDGVVLEEVISDLQTEYGTPATPQEFRLLIKLPEGSEPAIISPAGEPPGGSDEMGPLDDESMVLEEPSDISDEEVVIRRPRRRRRRRRGGSRGGPGPPANPVGTTDSGPSSSPNVERS